MKRLNYWCSLLPSRLAACETCLPTMQKHLDGCVDCHYGTTMAVCCQRFSVSNGQMLGAVFLSFSPAL
jgi:hypothetical protein